MTCVCRDGTHGIRDGRVLREAAAGYLFRYSRLFVSLQNRNDYNLRRFPSRTAMIIICDVVMDTELRYREDMLPAAE